MRSIPYAMTWELLRRGSWQMLLAVLGANLLSLLFLTALRMDGPLDLDDPGLVVMQMVLIQFQPILLLSPVENGGAFRGKIWMKMAAHMRAVR